MDELTNQRIRAAFDILRGLRFKPTKGVRDKYLRELRDLEQKLGIESTPYNNTNFYERSRNALLHLRRRTN